MRLFELKRVFYYSGPLGVALLTVALLSGCFTPPATAPVKHRFRDQADGPRRPVRDTALLPRPAHLLPFQGRYRGEHGKLSGYMLSVPESGWYLTTGQSMPGADVIFAHSEREPTDMFVAVAVADESATDNASDTLKTSLTAAARAHLNAFGRKFDPESFGVCENTAHACVFVAGAVEFPETERGPMDHDAAVVYVFPRAGGSVRLIFTFPAMYHDSLDHYVTEFATGFTPESVDLPRDTCPALRDPALTKKFKCLNANM